MEEHEQTVSFPSRDLDNIFTSKDVPSSEFKKNGNMSPFEGSILFQQQTFNVIKYLLFVTCSESMNLVPSHSALRVATCQINYNFGIVGKAGTVNYLILIKY